MPTQEEPCPFCSLDGAVLRSEITYCRFDSYPVTPGHLLVIPLRHAADFFSLTVAERAAMFALVDQAKALLIQRFKPDGYNLGINVGAAAGQTIGHVHLHSIPAMTAMRRIRAVVCAASLRRGRTIDRRR